VHAFFDNIDGYSDDCINFWDNGYPSGGNYWDDYMGIDIYHGPNQDIPGGDGIGDVPYIITGSAGNNTDRYPLMCPWGENPPIANFTYSIDDKTVIFNASTSYDRDSSIVKWSWDFGDGNISYEQNPIHQYASNGTYTVTLTVTDNNGLTDSKSVTITVGYISFTLDLVQGWNLITMSVENSSIINASDLVGIILGLELVSRFDPVTQMYKTYIVGGPSSFDFSIEDGTGYFVYVDTGSIASFSGTPISGASVSIYDGWNMIGWYQQFNTTASSLAGNITGCSMVSRFDTASQSFKTYIVGGPSTFDFDISAGMGIFIYTDQESVWNGGI